MLKFSFIVFCFCFGSLLAKPSTKNEFCTKAAEKFVFETSEKYSKFYDSLVKQDFDATVGVTAGKNVESSEEDDYSNDEYSDEGDGLFAFLDTLSKHGTLGAFVHNITAIADQVFDFPLDEFDDEGLKIAINRLRSFPGVLGLGDEFLKWYEDDFDDFLNKENYCKYKGDTEDCSSKYGLIAKAQKTSNDPDELLFYWSEWRTRNLDEIQKKMPQFIKLYNHLGEKNKKSAKYAWFDIVGDEHFDEEMLKVVEGLEPLYKILHAYIRQILHEHYGDKVPASGLIPNHLFEQARAQAWKPDSIITKELKNIKMPIQSNFNETGREVLDIASNFMLSLGLSELPEEFWSSRVKEYENDEGDDDCSGDIYNSGDKLYFIYCKDVTIKRFIQTHGYMAQLYYANEHRDLPFAFVNPYNLDFAAGEAVILSTTTPKYLHEIGHKDVDVLPEDEDINRLYRMGVHTILSVPQYYIHSKVMSDVLEDKILLKDMNKHYWELMAKYAGIAPPVERPADAIDFPQKFYNRIEGNLQTSKFIAEVIGYQIYESLCKKKW